MNNRLLMGSVVVVGAIWLIGPLIPNPYVSSAASLFLLVVGIGMLWRYSPAIWGIVFRQKRSEKAGEEGSHLFAYGAFLAALGSVYSGLFGLVWTFAGTPETWTGTTTSSFGRMLMAAGFYLQLISPDVRYGALRPARSLAWIVAMVVAFFAGRYLAIPAAEREQWPAVMSDRPVCPPERPVWGSSAHVYHTVDSPYRNLIYPIRCFMTEAEAASAGWRPFKAD